MRMLTYCLAAGFALMGQGGMAEAADFVVAQPLSQVVKGPIRACSPSQELRVPLIAWGGDMATIYANGNSEKTAPGSIFAKEGLSLSLYREDRLVTQLEDFRSCKTPFLRATMGMLAQASDVLNSDPRTRPVVIYQLTWSNGGDSLVVRDSVKGLADLSGKSVVLQAYGPHLDYLTTLMKDAGVPLSSITMKFVRDITEAEKGSMHPAKAFREDQSLAASFVITPDAIALTGGPNKIGSGAEDSVKGARMLLSTKTASRIIADVYIVRADWYEQNKDKAQAFVHALMLGQEGATKLMADKAKQQTAYKQFTSVSAKMLLGSDQAVADVEGMWGDAEFAGFKGNVSFFADEKNPVGLANLGKRIGAAFEELKLIGKPFTFSAAELDFAALQKGLSDTQGVEVPRFRKQDVENTLRQRQQQDRLADGQLFTFEISFKPNQSNFPSSEYGKEFDRVIELMSTYAGALLTIEGHADTLGYLKRKGAEGATPVELSNMKQGARNLTLTRANAVRDSLLGYAKEKGITLDTSQFATIGHGFMKPNVAGCTYGKDGDIEKSCAPRSEAEWNAMRRVVFRVVSVEAETTAFEAIK